MRIGIIGAGLIGSVIAKKLVKAGHAVKISNELPPEQLKDVEERTGATATTIDEAIGDAEVVITSVPNKALPGFKEKFSRLGENVVFIDTSNYFPARDNYIIEEIEAGKPESVWVSEQLGRPVVKAFSSLLGYTLEHEGTAKGTKGRIAMAIAGDVPEHKKVASQLVDVIGFDPLDSGSLEDSWRLQPGTPAYCTELTIEELEKALNPENIQRERSAELRDLSLQRLAGYGEKITTALGKGEYVEGFTSKHIVNLYRELFFPADGLK
ncbi:3-hydroxyisobutyrate dehydrogenase [Pontibacter diazotrophicus]|uniref:3-hydroxyisobutyrate dehydrogenase n=1 Tax=Pontibacter diazotrophicus TaxID=1400979 RepID=A0A3D8L7D1_9BACT|nr:NAD(P)-binding domain-containing protein [Pontibacter diazotrophicus]RDV13315.1 3-hydroxyisobutyrate dehydrogenase [Pontibacter diazotrophicus]